MTKHHLNSALGGLILAIIYFFAGRFAVAIHNLSGLSPLVWLPTGVGVAAIVLFGKKLWPWLFISSFVLSYSLHYSFLTSFGITVGTLLQTLLANWFIGKISDGRPTLTHVKEVIGFGILAMGVSTLLGTTISAVTFLLTTSTPFEEVLAIWRSWWLSQSMSCLIIAAPCICWWNDIRFRLGGPLKLGWEALLLAICIIATCIFIYTPLANYNHSLVIKPFFIFSLMIWASVRFDVFGATSTLLFVAITSVYGNVFGFTAASTAPPSERMVLQQYFIMALGFTGLVISAAIREKGAALEARSEFLSIASHELKTPIAALSLQLQVAERKIRAKRDRNLFENEQLAFLEKTGLQVSRLVQIVEQLLDVSRIDRRMVSLQFEEIDLSDFLRHLIERLESNLKAAGCEITLHLQNGLFCYWDPLRFEQVFENLLSNAAKYASGKPIQIETKQSNGLVEIAIRDHGPGIEKSKQAHIFDRFIRANSSPQIKGLGLGLFITKQIVEAHSGSIWVDSTPGEGTSFLMRIPIHPSSARASSLPTRSET